MPKDSTETRGGGSLQPDCSAPGKRIESEQDVDMWDEPSGSENTVSNLVRRYTAQWGLPKMIDGTEKAQNAERSNPAPKI